MVTSSNYSMVNIVKYGLDCYYSALEAGLSLKSTIGVRRSPQIVTTVTTVNYGTHKA